MLDDRRLTLVFDGFECILTAPRLQVCVSPDYVLIPRDAQDTFLRACAEVYVLSSMMVSTTALFTCLQVQIFLW